MDERDCRLLLEIMRTPFASLEELGRHLGITGKATKFRLDRLKEVGILGGLACGPGPAALGTESRLAVYQDRPIKCDLRDLLRLPNAVWAAENIPPSWTALFYTRPGESLPKGLRSLAGRDPDRVLRITELDSGAGEVLSPLDWKAMLAVMGHPGAPLRELAAACGLTARTVRTRRDKLLVTGGLFAFPELDTSREGGAILFGAYVRSTLVGGLDAIRLANSWRLNTHSEPPAAFLYGFVRTYAELRAVEQRLRSLPGVDEVLMLVPCGTHSANDRLRGWVRERVDFWERARGRVPPRFAEGGTARRPQRDGGRKRTAVAVR